MKIPEVPADAFLEVKMKNGECFILEEKNMTNRGEFVSLNEDQVVSVRTVKDRLPFHQWSDRNGIISLSDKLIAVLGLPRASIYKEAGK